MAFTLGYGLDDIGIGSGIKCDTLTIWLVLKVQNWMHFSYTSKFVSNYYIFLKYMLQSSI